MKKITLSILVVLAVSALLAPIATAQGFQLPTISVNPASYDFGQVPTFGVASIKITVTNSGDLALIVDAVKTKAPFQDNATSFTVPAHSSRNIEIYFFPTAQTTYSSVCTIQSNAHNAPVLNIPLTGEGI